MTRLPSRLSIAILLLGGLSLALGGLWGGHAAAAPARAITPFLYPPFPGTASEESIFDHSSPNYSQTDNRTVSNGGHEARKNCPSPEPAGTKPPQPGVCDQGFGIYWSYDLGGWMAYNGHDGIDYGITYRPVYAAADADQVMYSGWWDPQNHSTALGIYVKLHHSNGYITSYGHMSSVAVQACAAIGCAFLPHGEMLGISGTTGNSTGPHLHFQLTAPNGKSVDPYGWGGGGTDPWPYNQPESLWVMYPSLVYYGIKALPSGNVQLDYPAAVAPGILVDDASSAFIENPAGCWNDINVSAGQAQNNNMRYSKPRLTGPTCTGQWRFQQGSAPGIYAVYVRIPAVHATTTGAIYSVQHGGQTSKVVLDQEVFPNTFYVKDGWVYLGRYNFDGVSNEYVQLTNQTQDESAVVSTLEVGADAVRFVSLGISTPTPPQPVTVTATFTPTITRTPTVTRTPTASNTPTKTRTPTASFTPTITRTPTRTLTATITRTPTATRTATATFTPSRTPTPTQTRLPTATPLYRKINVYFADRFRLASNTPPFEVSGIRWETSSANLPLAALTEYFKGPGDTERLYGYVAIYNGFTGLDRLDVAGGIARVHLKGSCAPNGKDFTIADLITLNLKQFPNISLVKVYDQFGQTQNPDGPGDSEPLCLSPSFMPSLTPSITFTPSRTATPSRTPTVTRTPTQTPTPTRTPTPSKTAPPTVTGRPTATPVYSLVNVYFVDKRRFDAGTPPYEVIGKRWSLTSNMPGTVLNEYFKGPGLTEKYTYGWIAIYNGVTGYSRMEVSNGVARLYLTGNCNGGGGAYTIADLLRVNLKQFNYIKFLKIYDQNGNTEIPDGDSDSIPACLEP
jgi:peptidase M23-like protein